MQAISAMTTTAICAEALTRDFGPVRAVSNLSLEIPAGVIFGFLGPNGSGKTTTIRLLLGLLEPTQGRAEVLGCDTRTQSDAIRERCGTLLEHTGLYERFSAEDNLELFGRIWHVRDQERRARIKELLTQLGLWERRREKVAGWSRGMKQKLAVARALLHRPALIFLDEPTAGLDPMAAAALRDELAALAVREGVTVFLTTHNLTEAEKLCSQIGVIREGKLLAVGHPDELRARAASPQAEIIGRGFSEQTLAALRAQPDVMAATLQNGHLLIDLKREIEIAPLISLMVSSGAQIEEVHKSRASLEEVYLALMEDKP
jgi:ABC-2 type transport system ATP-binding protein